MNAHSQTLPPTHTVSEVCARKESLILWLFWFRLVHNTVVASDNRMYWSQNLLEYMVAMKEHSKLPLLRMLVAELWSSQFYQVMVHWAQLSLLQPVAFGNCRIRRYLNQTTNPAKVCMEDVNHRKICHYISIQQIRWWRIWLLPAEHVIGHQNS